MKFTLYNDVKDFHADVFDVLAVKEAQNLIILGNLMVGYEGKDTFGWRDPAAWVMAAVRDSIQDGGEVRLVALMTPPFGMTLYAVDGAGGHVPPLRCLIDGLIAAGINVPGVMTEKSLAQDFADIYCDIKGLGQHIETSLRIYELYSVNPAIATTNTFRLAAERDMAFLPYWVEAFNAEATNTATSVDADIEKYRYQLSQDRLHMLEVDGMAVAMAKINREFMGTAGIALVYTPPYFRGRGYATEVVARLSQKWLDKGFVRCVLYTDLANPTSNSIYQKIGYTPIADSLDIRFKEEVK